MTVTQTQALPEFVDVEEKTYNMDPARLREYLEIECERDPVTRQPISRADLARAIGPAAALSAMLPVVPSLRRQ